MCCKNENKGTNRQEVNSVKKKIVVFFAWMILIVFDIMVISSSEKNLSSVATTLSGALMTFLIERAWRAGVDIGDTTNWKTSQTKLKRGGYIKKDTLIRISFAYLYRIKVGGKYLLVQNSHNTKKYQPVGGVYKFEESEKQILKDSFHIVDDDKIPVDNISKNDYRLRMENRYLRKFVRRFNGKKASRERIENVGREFKEELVEKGILNWKSIKYRYCGRYMTELRFEEHFQIYELLLFDVVELIPSIEQERELTELLGRKDRYIHFATPDQINSLGIDSSAGKLAESIGDQTKVTIQEYETKLEKQPQVGKIYDVKL